MTSKISVMEAWREIVQSELDALDEMHMAVRRGRGSLGALTMAWIAAVGERDRFSRLHGIHLQRIPKPGMSASLLI